MKYWEIGIDWKRCLGMLKKFFLKGKTSLLIEIRLVVLSPVVSLLLPCENTSLAGSWVVKNRICHPMNCFLSGLSQSGNSDSDTLL